MKKALVLAGGLPQAELIKNLKNRGYFTILVDWGSNPIACKFCDLFFQVSTLDVEKVKKIAVDEEIDFLITVCTDQALMTVARLSEELKLPCYIDSNTALHVTNKEYMKNILKRYGIPTSKYRMADATSDVSDEKMKYPLIVKPVDCNSSKGVIKVNNTAELLVAIKQAQNLSRSGKALFEEFVVGQEISVDAYVTKGISKILNISQINKVEKENMFVIGSAVTIPVCSFRYFNRVSDIVQKIAEAFELNDSPLLVQMIINEDVSVIELSARTGGGEKFIVIKQLSGFDPIKAVIDLTEKKVPNLDIKNATYRCASVFIYCNLGILDHFEGIEIIQKEGIIEHFMVFKNKGSRVGGVSNSGDRVAGVIFHGNSEEELHEKCAYINKRIKIISTNGCDIMKHDIFINSIPQKLM